jgi:hypothetical protein
MSAITKQADSGFGSIATFQFGGARWVAIHGQPQQSRLTYRYHAITIVVILDVARTLLANLDIAV